MTELSREYGEGLYALCVEENIAKEGLDQLSELKRLFREHTDFCRLLSNRALGKAERLGILDAALRDQVLPYLLNFLKILCERGIISEFEGCVEAYRTFYNRDHAVVEAHVTTGEPLSESQQSRLLSKLQAMTGKDVRLVEHVDSEVLGGVLLEMEGKRYDNTLRHRLGEMRQMLTSRN